MAARRMVLRLSNLAFAALVAAASGGLILVLFLTLAAGGIDFAGPGDGSSRAAEAVPILLAMALMGGVVAVVPAASAAWLPAFAAGAALWVAGRNSKWRRGRLAWALGGAAAALFCYLRLALHGLDRSWLAMFPLPPAATAAAFLLTGAAAGQVFRSVLGATAPFFGFDDDDPEADEGPA